MSATAVQSPSQANQRIEELAQIILAYSEITEKLQHSHDRLEQTVRSLRTELSEKNRQLERSSRLAALGEMAAGIAHEIRNPLGGIQLYASLLEKDVGDRPDSLRLVKKVSLGVRRLETLVSQVLQFTREMKAQSRPADLAEVVDEAVGLASQAVSAKDVDVRVQGPRPMQVSIDPLLIGQALLNLLLNAVEAVESGGWVRIAYAPSGEGPAAGRFAVVVEDSGPGIPPQIIDRIFNPFFTTRETGTGLGLAIVHRVVEAHDGSIAAGSAPGGGARFEIRI